MYIDYIVYIPSSKEALGGFADRAKNKNSVFSSQKIATYGVQICT
jgi:hypothetical protein